MFGVPTMFNAMLNHPDFAKYSVASVENVMLGGAPSAPALVKAIQEKFGCRCIVGYGLTETTPVITLAWPKAHSHAGARRKTVERQARTGYAVPGTLLRVVDSNDHDVKWDGKQIGEIVVHSNVVMDGYYKEPDRDAQRDPRRVAAYRRYGRYRRGRLRAYRRPQQGYIISGGENISSVEIENVLYANPRYSSAR